MRRRGTYDPNCGKNMFSYFCPMKKIRSLHTSVSQHHFIAFFFLHFLFNSTHTAIWHLKNYFSWHQNIFFPLLFNHFCYYALLITTIELLLSRNARNLFDAVSILMNETKRKVPVYDIYKT